MKITSYLAIVLAILLQSLVANAGPKGDGRFVMPQNTLGLNPIMITNDYLGIGVGYERNLIRSGKLSIVLPVSIGWQSDNGISNVQTKDNISNVSYFINPGIKFYPFSNKRAFSYAVGISGFSHYGKADVNHNTFYDMAAKQEMRTSDITAGGILINNYLNFKIKRFLSFGLEFGVGPTLFNNYKPENVSFSILGGTTIYSNFAFQLAYHF